MLGRVGRYAVATALFLVALSCAELPGPETGGEQVPQETLPSPVAIPAEWGDLVSVTTGVRFASGSLLWFEDQAGTVRMVGTPLQMSDTPLEVQGPSPALSQHTDEILASTGYGPDEIASLREAGVIR